MKQNCPEKYRHFIRLGGLRKKAAEVNEDAYRQMSNGYGSLENNVDGSDTAESDADVEENELVDFNMF